MKIKIYINVFHAFPAQIRVLRISTSLHAGTWKEIFCSGPALIRTSSCCVAALRAVDWPRLCELCTCPGIVRTSSRLWPLLSPPAPLHSGPNHVLTGPRTCLGVQTVGNQGRYTSFHGLTATLRRDARCPGAKLLNSRA